MYYRRISNGIIVIHHSDSKREITWGRTMNVSLETVDMCIAMLNNYEVMKKDGIVQRCIWRRRMKREDFFNWLDTIIDKGNSDWEVVEDFADGNIWIKFNNILEEEDETT